MFVIRRRGTQIPSFYKDKVAGASARFQSDTAGRAFIFEYAASAAPADRAARGITEPDPPVANAIDVRLPFGYFVGAKQIQAWKVDPSTGDCARIVRRTDYPADGGLDAGELVYTALGGSAITFDEVGTKQVRLHNVFPGDIFLIGYGHTAAPASLGRKLLVENQADNIGVELEGAGDGIVLRTPDGTRVRLTVHNGLGTRVERV